MQTNKAHWLKKDYKINWRTLGKGLGVSLLFCLLPNVLAWLGAYWVGVARPIINVDYVSSALLFAMPFRPMRYLGMIALVVAIMIDAMMMAMQLFPFLNIRAALSLAPFLVNAPTRYQGIAVVVGAYLALMPFVMYLFAKIGFVAKSDVLHMAMVAGLFWVGYHNFNEYKYVNKEGERFAQSDFYYIHSQYRRYKWVDNSEFADYFNKTPTLMPIKQERGTDHLGNYGASDKILVIVAESWGVPRTEAMKTDEMAGIYKYKDRLEFIERGLFAFSGATVEGELRELCGMGLEGGYAFSRLSKSNFTACLPQKYARLGYYTIGMHGGFSSIYERNYLYPHLGFMQTYFAQDFKDKKRCQAFNGICDGQLTDTVAAEFERHKKLFYYWLTLTSHSAFPEKDIYNQRFNCNKHSIPKGDICNNFRLQAQFFDELGELIARPEMAGVEVIVAGDHMPPVMMREPIHPYLHWQDVSWLHFKVKP